MVGYVKQEGKVKAGEGVPEKFAIDHWFNYSHQHLDWRGRGNWSRRAREYYIAGYARLFRLFAQLLAERGQPFQLWILLVKSDSGHDAVFIHSPNPHTNFPVELSEVDWDVAPTGLFRELLPEFQLREGHSKTCLFFYAENVGVPLGANEVAGSKESFGQSHSSPLKE